MRVAIFTDTFLPDVNGVAKTLGKWADYLEKNQIPCKVFAPNYNMMNMFEAEQDVLVKRFLSIPFILYPECRLTIANPLSMNRAIDDFAPTLIHVATPFTMGLYGQRYAYSRNIPLVASYHTHFDQYLSYYNIRWLENAYWKYMQWFHQDCEKVFVPSESTRQYLLERGFSDLEIWSRGIDLAKFYPLVDRQAVLQECRIDEDEFVILYVGRIAPEKDMDVLIETFETLPKRIRNNAHLVIAGDGPMYRGLVATNEKTLNSRITYLGFTEGAALQRWYAAADIFLFPSPTETFGNVILEAMASGTPVIGAAQGGVQDIIEEGVTGLLCPAGDVQAFRAAVVKLYDDSALRARIAQEALAYSRLKSWDSIFAQLLLHYQQISAQDMSELVV